MKKPYFHIKGVPWGENYAFRLLAISKFEKALGNTLKKNLLSLGSPIGEYYLDRASGIFHLPKEQYKSIINQIKTVVYFAEEALKIDAEKVIEASDIISEKYEENNEQLVIAREKLNRKEENITKKIQNVLECYHSLYEQGYKMLISFPIIAKEILIRSDELENKSIENYIDDDPSYKTNKIQSPLIIGGYQTIILLDGYNNHVRNAIAHRKIEFPDPDKEEVILKDQDKRRGKKWEKKFSYFDLLELTIKLDRTILSLELALGIFNVNNKDLLGKYLKDKTIPPSPRKIRDDLYSILDSMGFDIINIDKDDQFNKIKIRARTRPSLQEALKGPSELFWFDGKRHYSVRLPSVDFSANIRENALGAFGRSEEILIWFKHIKIDIVNEENKKIAMITCDNPEDFFNKLKKCNSKAEADELISSYKLYVDI